MQCHEIQDQMKRFIDGEVDGETRKLVGLHLAECDDCMRLINEDKFWDEAVVELFEREAPADLRDEILGDLAEANPRGRSVDLSGVGWKKRLKFFGWAATRNTNTRQLFKALAWVLGGLVVMQLMLRFLD